MSRGPGSLTGSSLNEGSFLGSFFIRVPYYIGGLERDPSLENYLNEASYI